MTQAVDRSNPRHMREEKCSGSGAPVEVVGGVAHAVDEGVPREVLLDGVLQHRMELGGVGRAASQGAANHVQR
jgi:hypothetical protein